MPPKPLDVVRTHLAAYRRDDVEGALAFLDEEVVVDTTRGRGGVGAVSHGPHAVVREVQRFMGAFENYEYEIERISDLGGGAILVAMIERGLGKSSGVPVEHHGAALYNVLDGMIVRITGFASESEALAAVGGG